MIRVAGVQVGAVRDKADNVQKVRAMLDAVGRLRPRPDFVCLPELFSYLPGMEDNYQRIEEVAEGLDGPIATMLSEMARRLAITVVGGSYLQKSQGRHYNTCLVFGPDGELLGTYSKVHLFHAPDFQESRFVEAGTHFTVIETELCTIGIIICYDIRFPELLRTLVLKGADVIFCPAAFPIAVPSPGYDHWEILTRAAALQNMVYLVAVNQIGYRAPFYYFGRSVIVDPWGIEIAKAPNKECIFTAELDLKYLNEMREIRSPLKHRRPDVYDLG